MRRNVGRDSASHCEEHASRNRERSEGWRDMYRNLCSCLLYKLKILCITCSVEPDSLPTHISSPGEQVYQLGILQDLYHVKLRVLIDAIKGSNHRLRHLDVGILPGKRGGISLRCDSSTSSLVVNLTRRNAKGIPLVVLLQSGKNRVCWIRNPLYHEFGLRRVSPSRQQREVDRIGGKFGELRDCAIYITIHDARQCANSGHCGR